MSFFQIERSHLVFQILASRWEGFRYNYQWHDYVPYLDGWIVRFAATIPILGYLILFNDEVTAFMNFDDLTSGQEDKFWLTGSQRLRLLYFGMLLLALANLLYRIRRPYVLKCAPSLEEYLEWADRLLTFSDLLGMHRQIRSDVHVSQDGKYWDSDWDAFRLDAQGSEDDASMKIGDWGLAKQKHGNLIRSILRETYYRSARERRASLSVCLFIAILGYSFLAIPSLDLFFRVFAATFLSV